MIKYILSTIIAVLCFSCGVINSPEQKQSSKEYSESLKDSAYLTHEKKWQTFAKSIGFEPKTLNSFKLLKQELSKTSKLMDFSNTNKWVKNLEEIIEKKWNETPRDSLIASEIKLVGTAIEKKHNDTLLTTLRVLEYKVKGETHYAYLSIPEKQEGNPLVYFHKDDRGLSWELMKEEVGIKTLKTKVVIAPAGPGQALCKTYTQLKDCKEEDILYASSQKKVLSWSDDADDAISLMRALVYTHEGHNLLQSCNTEFIGSYDLIGFSKGGLTAALTTAKIGYLNKPTLLSYLKNKDEKAFESGLFPNKLIFIHKLVTVSAPLTLIHGPFQLVLKDCVTGAIKDSKYKDYPGVRHLVNLFDDYRKATQEDEQKAMDELKFQTLSRDFMFLSPYFAGAMPSLYFKKLQNEGLSYLTKPRIAFLHHKKDKFIPSETTLFLQRLFSDQNFKKGFKDNFSMVYDLKQDNFFGHSKKDSKSKEFHLESKFWESKNKGEKSPREVIDQVLDSMPK